MARSWLSPIAQLFKNAKKPVRPAGRLSRLNCEALEDRVNPAPAIALGGVTAGAANLLSFDTDTPATVSTIAVTGIDIDESLVGIDFRPLTGELYALGVDPGTGDGTLYIIVPSTGVATIVGGTVDVNDGADIPLTLATGYGFDFNPTVDQIRVVFGAESFRLSPVAAANQYLGSNGDINGATTALDASAYTNNRAVTGGTTTLYGINSATDTLYTQVAGTGLTTAVGTGLGFDFATLSGFDIPEAGTTTGFALTTFVVTPQLYSIDLANGTASSLGTLNALTTISGFTLVPAGTVAFQIATPTVAEGGGSATIVLTRTGGTTGPIDVTVMVSGGGTATAGTDFTPPGPYTVTFLNGETTANLVIAITPDMLVEGNETVNLTITAVDAGAIGVQATSTLTITDDDFSIAFQNATATVSEGVGTLSIVLNRTGVTTATSVVTMFYSGNAEQGTDFTPSGPYTVTFNPGDTTATLNLTVVDDSLVESNEAIVLTIVNVTGGGSIGNPSSTFVAITDNDVAPTPPADPAPAPAPAPTPVITGAFISNGFLVVLGPDGQPSTIVAAPPGLTVFFGDLNGDGKNELVLSLPGLTALIDSVTGQFLAISTDVTGDGLRDLLVFSPITGALETVIGGNGQVLFQA